MQSPVNLMGEILKPLLGYKRPSKDIKDLYKENAEKCTRPSFHELSKILRFEVLNYSKVYVILDGLDEYPEEQCDNRTIRLDELRSLQQMTLERESFSSTTRSSEIQNIEETGVNPVITSRHPDPIAPQVEEAKQLEIVATPEDIRAYVAARNSGAGRLSEFVHENEDLKENFVTRIAENPLMQGLGVDRSLRPLI